MTRKTISAGLATLACACSAMLFSSSPAFALNTHVFSTSFGSEGSGAGQVSSPAGLAVNSTTHDVYVADLGNFRIDQFSPSGSFIRAWGWGVADGLPSFETCTVTCQAGRPGSGAGQFETPAFVAVDDSSGPSVGDVYVGDSGDNLVSKFDSAGNLMGSWGKGGQLEGSSPSEPFGSIYGVAVDAGGTLMVINLNKRVFEFAQSGTFTTDFEVERGVDSSGLAVDAAGNFFKANGEPSVEELTSAGSDVGQVTISESATGLAVDLATGDLYADEGGHVEQYVFPGTGEVSEPGGFTCTFGPESGCDATDSFGSGTLIGGRGVGVDSSSGTVYVADASANRIDAFIAGMLPDATTGAASKVTPTGATLEGEVNPDGLDASSFFEYGSCETPAMCSTSAYGQPAPTVQAAGGPSPGSSDDGSGVTNVPVEASVTGLIPNQAYHYRLVGHNVYGDGPPGAEEQFTTLVVPPLAETLPASFVTFGGAVLDGTVNPENSETAYHFEYGLCETPSTCAISAYTSKTPAQRSSAYGVVGVSEEVEGLQPSSVYHYRLVATNSAGADSVSGPPEVTFTTAPAPPLVVESGAASSVTQTAAVISGTVDPDGLASSYGFHLGTEAGAYGPAIGLGRLAAGFYEARSVTLALDGLQPGVTYHYRLVASTAYATVDGADRTFTTTGVSSSFTQPLAPPLLATPPISFPGQSKVTTGTSKCKRGYKRDRHGRCVRTKHKKKAKGRGKRAHGKRKQARVSHPSR